MATTTHTGDTHRDRQRAREERGVQSTSTANAAAERLPPPPRERKPALAALAVLLIVGGAAVAGLLAVRADSRVPVLVADMNIPAGVQITEASLTTTRVAAEGARLIPESRSGQVIGQYAKVEIAEGQLIDTTMTTPSGLLDAPDSVAVGAMLAAGRLPASGLREGDLVDLIQVSEGSGNVLVVNARVGQVISGTDAGSGVTVTLFVSRDGAPAVTAAATAGELSVVLLERGVPIAERED